jgi:hypothetical protein
VPNEPSNTLKEITITQFEVHNFSKRVESWRCRDPDKIPASATPIFKDMAKKKDIKNYRPISVTSIVGKVLERHVRNKTNEHLIRENVIPKSQHGFTNGRSWVTLY